MTEPTSVAPLNEEVLPLEEAGLGTLSTPNGNLPLKQVRVFAQIAGLYAHTTLEQTFKNTLQHALEAAYIFPLPPRAAVTGFVMQVGERRIEGVLEERQKARQEYKEAIRQGHRAAITEQERQNVFTLRVGNLMPGEEAHITFRMVSPLDVDAGEVTYRFPLVVAPRYIPGTPLEDESVGDGVVSDTDQVPDASRITPPVLLPGFPNPVHLSIQAEIENTGGISVRDLRSSLHAISTEEHDGVIRVEVRPGDRLNRDFILRYRLLQEDFAAGAVASPDAEGSHTGTFHCLITAPPEEPGTRPPRDIAFVLDRSGSMAGWKMEAARRVTGRLLDSLTTHDRFALIAFDTAVETFAGKKTSSLYEANNQNRYQAMEWLAHIGARGGTEVLPALEHATTLLEGAKRPEAFRAIVLVTDGQVGNEDAVVRRMSKAGIAMFVVGVDIAVNDALTRRLAQATGGTCELIESEQRLDEVLDRLTQQIGAPVLRNIHVTAEGTGLSLIADDCVPSDGFNLYAGGVALMMGRYTAGSQDWHLRVWGVLPDGRRWQQEVKPRFTDHPAIRPAWARALINQLEDDYVLQATPELEERILRLSLENRVLCRFTAYVAIDRSEVVNAGGEVRRIVQPVDAPASWDMFSDTADVCVADFESAPRALYCIEKHFAHYLEDYFVEEVEENWSVSDYLRILRHVPPIQVASLLHQLEHDLQVWMNALRRKPRAAKMVQQLQALLDAIQQPEWHTDQQALEQLLQLCRETLEALDRSGLLSRRRGRWW